MCYIIAPPLQLRFWKKRRDFFPAFSAGAAAHLDGLLYLSKHSYRNQQRCELGVNLNSKCVIKDYQYLFNTIKLGQGTEGSRQSSLTLAVILWCRVTLQAVSTKQWKIVTQSLTLPVSHTLTHMAAHQW